MLCDLELGSGEGHVNIHSTCRTTCTLNHVTAVSRTTEIWPFKFRQILILDEMAEEIDLEKCTFRNFGSSVTLTLDGVEVTLVRMCGPGVPTPNYMEIGKSFCGRTDGRTHLSSNLLGHRFGDDLEIVKNRIY